MVNQWDGGFQGEVTVTNNSSSASGTAWSVSWVFEDGQVINQLWNGEYTQTGNRVIVNNVSWNGDLGPGQSTSFGFLASWNGVNGPPILMSCTRY